MNKNDQKYRDILKTLTVELHSHKLSAPYEIPAIDLETEEGIKKWISHLSEKTWFTAEHRAKIHIAHRLYWGQSEGWSSSISDDVDALQETTCTSVAEIYLLQTLNFMCHEAERAESCGMSIPATEQREYIQRQIQVLLHLMDKGRPAIDEVTKSA